MPALQNSRRKPSSKQELSMPPLISTEAQVKLASTLTTVLQPRNSHQQHPLKNIAIHMRANLSNTEKQTTLMTEV